MENQILYENINKTKISDLKRLCDELDCIDLFEVLKNKIELISNLENANNFDTVAEILKIKNSEEYKTKKENNLAILDLKKQLQETDYKALKFLEGQLSEQDYLPIKQLRINLRKQLNDKEK